MNKGTSRETRKNIALSADYISVDERNLLDRMQFTLNFSQLVNFYGPQNKVAGHWHSFLLNDPAFIIAMIAATDLNQFKLNTEDFEYQPDLSGEITHVRQVTNELLAVVESWSGLLSGANYKGTLQKEIDKLLGAVNDWNNFPEENPDLTALKENYESIFGSVVYMKGKAVKSFDEELLKSNHQPHIGLLIAFFKLFKNLQKDINAITGKHLDFYYLDLLQQKQKKAVPASAILALKLQPGASELQVNAGDRFDFVFENKQQSTFEVTAATTINKAQITDVRTLYKSNYHPFSDQFNEDDFSINILYQADVLDQLNNLPPAGADENEFLPATLGEEKAHQLSNNKNITLSDVGILITSPALILEKGRQEINLTFKITPTSYAESRAAFEGLVAQEFEQERNVSPDREKLRQRIVSDFFNDAFLIYLTTSGGWKPADHCRSRINRSDSSLSFDILLNPETEILVPFDAKIHDGNFNTVWPCIKILLNNNAQYHPYKIMRSMVIEDITVKAQATAVTCLTLSNPTGNLDSSIPFMPFGPAPVKGGYLRIQNPVILQQNLSALELSINWSGLPQIRNGFTGFYAGYPGQIDNDSFQAILTQNRNTTGSTEKERIQTVKLFECDDEFLSNEKKIAVNLDNFSFKKQVSRTAENPSLSANAIFLVLTSPDRAFGHQIFPEIYAEAALRNSRFRRKPMAMPNQPYTPVIERLEVSYTNIAREIMMRKLDEKATDVKFIHIYPFGHVQVFPGPVKSQSFLLPQIQHKGSLFIGLEQIKPADIVSIGFELVPAVYIHTVINVPKIQWEYLSNNEWVPFKNLLLEDSTDGMLKSGIVKIKVPADIQLENTYLPKGKFWIRAVYEGTEDINSKIKRIFTQAVSIRLNDQISGPLPDLNNGNKIQKVNFAGKSGLGPIAGPFAVNMNEPPEKNDSFYARVSEQLRHKNRAVSNWDMERLILDRFSQIEKVRVYGRNSHPKELVKGSDLQVVVIPKNKLVDGTRRRSTKVDFSTLLDIKKYVSQFVSPWVNVEVSNPVYEQLKIRCQVKFNDPQKSGYLISALNNELISYLSPDIENEFIEKGFDESISKTEILNFIESRPYVEFVTEFSVLQLVDVQGQYKIIDTARIEKIKDLRTISAYAILTSAPEHQIEVIGDEKPQPPQISGIGDLSIESDFVISDADGNYI